MEYANHKRTTRREAFLEAMESIIPWNEWMALIAPYYVQKERGRKLIPLETMLRMYLMQNWFGLSDEGIEDAIYDSYAMKQFLRIDFSTEQTPDATTLLHFRHLLEKHVPVCGSRPANHPNRDENRVAHPRVATPYK